MLSLVLTIVGEALGQSHPEADSFFASLGGTSIEAFQVAERLGSVQPALLSTGHSLLSNLLHLTLGQFASSLQSQLTSPPPTPQNPPVIPQPLSSSPRDLTSFYLASSIRTLSRSNRTSAFSNTIPTLHVADLARPQISVVWRLFMGKCVDASPLLITNEQEVPAL